MTAPDNLVTVVMFNKTDIQTITIQHLDFLGHFIGVAVIECDLR